MNHQKKNCKNINKINIFVQDLCGNEEICVKIVPRFGKIQFIFLC